MQSHLPSHSFDWTIGSKGVYLRKGMGPHWALGRTEDFFLFSKLGIKLRANPEGHKSTGKELQKQHSPREVQRIIFYRMRVLIILYFLKNI